MAGFPPLTEAKRVAVAARIAAGHPAATIAREEGVNVKTVRKMARHGVEAPAVAIADRTEARLIAALKDEISRLRRDIDEERKRTVFDEAVLTVIGDLAVAPSTPPAWLANPTKKVRRLGHALEVPVVGFADWHCGEVVNANEVNGVNEYNLDIADKRIERLVSTTIDLCRNHHNKDYPGIVVNALGDFVSGALHPELAKTDELEILPTTLWVLDRLEAAIAKLADEFGRVFVPCVAGNHGRNTLKPEAKRYVYKNFDWLIYQLLARRFDGDDRVSFLIDDSNTAHYRIFGSRFMVAHGDQMGVKGGDGIIGAIGPIMRGEIKTRGQASTLGKDYDYLCIGHWHQPLWLPRAIVANSLKGFDEYAQNFLRAVPTTPSQPLFFVHPKWGITSRWEVYVENPNRGDASLPWVSVFNRAA